MNLDNIGKDKVIKGNFSFTKDQQNAIDGIISFIATPFNPAKYIVGLTGAGGTGKTFITKYIIRIIIRYVISSASVSSKT